MADVLEMRRNGYSSAEIAAELRADPARVQQHLGVAALPATAEAELAEEEFVPSDLGEPAPTPASTQVSFTAEGCFPGRAALKLRKWIHDLQDQVLGIDGALTAVQAMEPVLVEQYFEVVKQLWEELQSVRREGS